MRRLSCISLVIVALTIPSFALAAICQTDMDCKGERICEGGECVYPPMRPAAQPEYAPPPTGNHRGHGIFAMWRKGLQMEIRGGLSVCVEDDDAECEGETGELDPGGGFGAAFLVRFLPFLAVGLDFGYYMFNPEFEGEDELDKLYSRMLTAMIQARGYLPFKYADIFFKLSGGYTSYKEGAERGSYDYSLRLFAPVNIKLGMGGSFFLIQDRPIGDIGLGIDFDYVFTIPYKLEYCEDGRCAERDINDIEDDYGDVDLIDNFQLNLHFTWVFPVF